MIRRQVVYDRGVEKPRVFPPIGVRLTRTARLAEQAFDHALTSAGGSIPTWQILLSLRTGQWATQAEMAQAMGITAATLTHHLGGLERSGLVRRWREDGNRRVQRVELTDAGVALFDQLRGAAAAHDKRLRATLSDADVDLLADLLDRLRTGLEGS